METIIQQHGRFALLQTEEGFCWCLTARSGGKWYWHPETRQWTPKCQPCSTEERATIELDWTLTHEDAGDLDEQHVAPPRGPHASQG